MNGALPFSVASLGTLDGDQFIVGAGDFDGNGTADLLVRSDLGYNIWFMNGSTVQESGEVNYYSSSSPVDAIGDFDGDGYADLFVNWWQLTSRMMFMRGETTVGVVPGPLTAGYHTSGICTPDVNGDGMSDQVRSDASGTEVWLMDGATLMHVGATGRQMGGARLVGCGDANGDGFGDLLWYDPNTGRGTLWTMDGDAEVDRSLQLPQLAAGWAIEASGDFDGDGRANDILVRNQTTGRIEVWRLQWNSWLTGFSVVSTDGAGMGSGNWEVVAP